MSPSPGAPLALAGAPSAAPPLRTLHLALGAPRPEMQRGKPREGRTPGRRRPRTETRQAPFSSPKRPLQGTEVALPNVPSPGPSGPPGLRLAQSDGLGPPPPDHTRRRHH